MKRPLMVLLMGLVLGELAGHLFYRLGFLMPASLLAVILLDCKTTRKLKPFFIPGLAFLCAMSVGLISWNMEQKRVDQAAWLVGHLAGRKNEIKGQVVDRKESASGYLTYTIKNPVIYDDGKIIMSGKMQLTGEKSPEHEYLPGDMVIFYAPLEGLEHVRNPGEFDRRNYSLAQGIFLTGFFDEARMERRPSFSVRRMAYVVKTTMEYSFLTYLKPEDSAMICAMALGDKTYLTEEEKKLYEENGVAHLLAISGLHVSIVGGRIYRTLRKKGCTYGLSCLGGASLLFFYGCMTGMGTSVMRAFLMYLVYLFSEWTGGEYDLVSSMSLSGIFMLLEHPYRLLEGGFQVSYTCVLTIGCVFPYFFIEDNKKDKNRKQKIEEVRQFGVFRKKIAKSIASSAILYAVTGPLILYHFYELTPYGILLNPVVLPWMNPLMLDALFGGILGIPIALSRQFPMFSTRGSPYIFLWKLLSLPAIGIIRSYHWILYLVRRLPGALLVTGCPPIWAILLIYMAELAALYFYKKGWRRGLVALFVGLGILFAGTYHQKLKIIMLDVGQGECILIQLPHGKNILVDGGSISQKEIYKKIMEPAFRYYGVTSLDFICVTHMDEDHISGISELLENDFPVRYFATGKVRETCNDARKQMLDLAQEHGAEVILLEEGDLLRFGKTKLACLHPDGNRTYDNANDESLVLHLIWKEFHGLFTGDLGMEEESNLPLPEEKITLLKLAHHGSKYSTSDRFLARLKPQYAILSAGARNHYGHPHEELIHRVEAADAALYQTIEEGAIVLESNGRNTDIHYFACDSQTRNSPER